jgi:hypothetical protein
MNPLLLDVNRTPNSNDGPVPVSVVPGVVVLGQIVHGHVGGGGALTIVMLSVACAVCTGPLESVTCTVKLVVPVPVGVPDITPPADSPSPAGRFDPDTSVQLYGGVPPPAVNA